MTFLEKIKKNWVVLALVGIILVGIFLRTYNFNSGLFFQADQARDLNVVARAIDGGPGWLPLLGPKAGGTYLRLGPVFYYFEYISALIFGMSTPAILAYPDLLFSILSIPLFFLLLKEFFSKKYALLLVSGYAVCFFEIQYARFAWNPNSLPFFNLFFFYAIFKFFQTNSGRAKFWWAVLAGAAYAIVSQLHFVSLLSLPIALVLIFAVRKMLFKDIKEKWFRYLGVMILIFLIFYLPTILSDFQTGGNNALNFLKSIGQKSSDTTSLISLLQKDAFIFSKYFLVILTGVVDAAKSTIDLFTIIVVSLFATGIFVFKREVDRGRKFFVALMFVWFISYFLTYFPLGSKLQPRHFLVILPLTFILVGLLAHGLSKFVKLKFVSSIAIVILLMPIIANVYSLKIWFAEIADSQKKISTYRKSSLLKSVGGESWWHLEKTAEFMYNDCEKDKLIILPPKESYRSLYDYSLEYVGEKRLYSIQWGSFSEYADACYYVIGFAKNDISNIFGTELKKIKYVQFGDIAVTRFDFADNLTGITIRNPFKKNNGGGIEFVNAVNDEDIDSSLDHDTSNDSNADVDNGGGANLNTTSDSLLDDIGRKDRVFWRDLFDGKME